MNKVLVETSEQAGATAPELNVKVNFAFYVDESVAPRKIQVSCPADATVPDLIRILCDRYEGLRSSLEDENLMAIVNGVSHGKRLEGARLRTADETEVEVWFMRFIDHGG
jgi:hypothetical protein